MSKVRKGKQHSVPTCRTALGLGDWCLAFVCDLGFGVWDFSWGCGSAAPGNPWFETCTPPGFQQRRAGGRSIKAWVSGRVRFEPDAVQCARRAGRPWAAAYLGERASRSHSHSGHLESESTRGRCLGGRGLPARSLQLGRSRNRRRKRTQTLGGSGRARDDLRSIGIHWTGPSWRSPKPGPGAYGTWQFLNDVFSVA